jgi:hypothetical protein
VDVDVDVGVGVVVVVESAGGRLVNGMGSRNNQVSSNSRIGW